LDVHKGHIKFYPSECYCVQNCYQTQLWNTKASSFQHGQRKQLRSQWCLTTPSIAITTTTTTTTTTITMLVFFPVPEHQLLLGTLPPPPNLDSFYFIFAFCTAELQWVGIMAFSCLPSLSLFGEIP